MLWYIYSLAQFHRHFTKVPNVQNTANTKRLEYMKQNRPGLESRCLPPGTVQMTYGAQLFTRYPP